MNKQTREHLRDALLIVREVSTGALNGLELKWCYQCRRVLAKEAFYKHRSRADGLDSRCKECTMIRNKEKRSAPSKKVTRNFVMKIINWFINFFKKLLK